MTSEKRILIELLDWNYTVSDKYWKLSILQLVNKFLKEKLKTRELLNIPTKPKGRRY